MPTRPNRLTLVYFSMTYGHIEAIKVLLDQINGPNQCEKWPPLDSEAVPLLIHASQWCSSEVCQLLLNKHVDVNCKDSYSNTPLLDAIFTGDRNLYMANRSI